MRIQNNVYHGVQEEDQSQIVTIFYISATRSYRTSGSFNLFHNTSFYHSLYLTNMQKKCAMNYLKQYKICQEPAKKKLLRKCEKALDILATKTPIQRVEHQCRLQRVNQCLFWRVIHTTSLLGPSLLLQ